MGANVREGETNVCLNLCQNSLREGQGDVLCYNLQVLHKMNRPRSLLNPSCLVPLHRRSCTRLLQMPRKH